jgi:hypothetical protein
MAHQESTASQHVDVLLTPSVGRMSLNRIGKLSQ